MKKLKLETREYAVYDNGKNDFNMEEEVIISERNLKLIQDKINEIIQKYGDK